MAYGTVVGANTASTDDIATHNSSATAHPSILTKLEDIEDRIRGLEIASGAEVTANPFAVTFGNLDGIQTDGVWNQSENRIEF